MRSWISVALFIGIALSAQAQTAPSSTDAGTPPLAKAEPDAIDRGVRLKSLPRNILQDQEALFTSPFHMNEQQWKLTVPLSAIAVVLVASDTAVEAHVTKTASTASHVSTFSDAGLATMAGVGGGMYLWGALAKNEHQRETGFLSGEAAIDAYLDTTAIKYIAGRDRPFTANGKSNFFDGGSSFPSQHSAVSWAIASVIAHEYPGPMTKILSYGLAGAVSAARVEGHDHFMSDAVIGSAMGWFLGRQVYRARSSDAEIDPRNWGRFERDAESEQARTTSQMGSSYVPLDSWVYGAVDRLAAMGYVRSSSAVVRPWTRLECARLVQEARDAFEEVDPIAAPLIDALGVEFTHEENLMDGGRNQAAQVESVYARFTGISGSPLLDSYHFAQTLVDDDGRPYGQGANGIAGISSHAEAGPLAFYVQGEYQYASAIPAYNLTAQQTLAAADGLPYGWNLRLGTTSRVRPVEAYAALNMSDWQLSFGQQTLWWGPDRSTSMILSNNAEALPMVRLERVKPLRLPGFLGGLGQIRGDFFLAREGGIHYVRPVLSQPPVGSASQGLNPPPYIWGITVSIKPTENLEFGLGHDAIFAGYSRPFTLHTFLHSFSLTGNNQAVDPGKRTTEFNFSYRVPGLRKWLVLYSEGFAYDNPVTGKFFERFGMDPGVYLPQIPGLRRLDFRAEAVNSNPSGELFEGYFYSNQHYAQGYTNYGQIFGSWIGRQDTGGVATSTYWFSARNKASVSYRKLVADDGLLQGGHLADISGSITWMVRPNIELSASSQYESWRFPLLAAGARTNTATSFGVRYYPKMQLGSDTGRMNKQP